ncbi:cation:proton antiporter [Haloarcula sediminis]|uniref:cation:proton antiporter n=1 Tax=Haloarcula sediminis TaxID=3111777 RepID=UPI002D784890|nr:cation:proton antiporter [Haloarcula sp. CK38]
MAAYEIALLVTGFAILGAVVLPRILADKPMSFPLLYVGLGALVFWLPTGVTVPDPVTNPNATRRLTELVIIISLMGAGLKLDRPFDWQAWSPTWRLLAVAMPLTIIAVSLLGWGMLGLSVPVAVLLGAVIAPTDPVLASSVEASPPESDMDEEVDPTEQEGAIRFALTSEAGLNDGLAFPFTYLAVVMAGASQSPFRGGWLLEWLGFYVVYKIAVGVVGGVIVGYLIARFIFGRPSSNQLSRVMEGAEALAATLLAYAATELVAGYGFIAVFVAALVMRHYEWEHAYYQHLHDFAVVVERLLMATVLVLFGGVLVQGLLAPLTLIHVAVGLAILLVVRPVAGMLATVGSGQLFAERAVIAGFGIRGIGSFFYLAYALNTASLSEYELVVAAEELWALLGFIVVTSLVLHGISAAPVMNTLDQLREGDIGEGAPADDD